MYAAASGMAAQQQNLEIIADNLANADVAGFKRATASFADVNAGGSLGLGTASLGRHALFVQGKLEKSDGPFDVALDGREVPHGGRQILDTRRGSPGLQGAKL